MSNQNPSFGAQPMPPPPGYAPAPPRMEQSFQTPVGYKLQRKRRWPWILLGIIVVIGLISVVAKPKDAEPADQPTTTLASVALVDVPAAEVPAVVPADVPVAPAQLVAGQSDTTSGFEVTLIQTIDPWIPTNQFESPPAGKRFVAVELTMLNTTSDLQSFSTILGLEVVDSIGQHWNIAFAGIDLPRLDVTLVAGELIRGWQVFEVPNESTGLQLIVKGSLTASGITFAL